MKKTLLLVIIFMSLTIASFAQWTTLASDGVGDGSSGGPTFLDGTKLEYRYDDMSDSVWFRVTVANVLNANYGINIIMNVTGAGATVNWFGSNTSFKYNRIITAWITSGTSGTVGITDAAGFGGGNYTKLGANNVNISIDATNKTYTLGLKRTSIYNDTVLKADIIAGVGSNQYWDDDVPNSGSGSVNLKPAPSSIESLDLNSAGYSIYPNPSNGMVNITRSNAGTRAQIVILNNIGQNVYSAQMGTNDTNLSINMSSYSKGLYFIKIISVDRQMHGSLLLK
ncbi:MAG: T9SS type A sorting domain-containing protein [Chitinophagales bacterium]|nr:T9SS type A sorting domain-containing protein [Chitinophagaceae bacterium]MCB9063901.1 T9SS type A sorting domain-containing protein [Chitinophagales bacterium]